MTLYYTFIMMSTKKEYINIKGLVHPKKMKILSVFTHPHVVPNLYFVYLFC